MKLAFHLILPLIATLSVVSVAKADTTLSLNSGAVDKISGSARSTTKISAQSFYAPLFQLTGTTQPEDCQFPEDQLSIDGDTQSMMQSATQTATGYSISIPVQGMRGNCPYALDKVILFANDGKIIQDSYMLQSAMSVAAENKLIGAPPSEDKTKDLSTLGSVYCDYSSDSLGFCATKKDLPAGPVFSVSSTPKNYTLNFKDYSLLPKPKY